VLLEITGMPRLSSSLLAISRDRGGTLEVDGLDRILPVALRLRKNSSGHLDASSNLQVCVGGPGGRGRDWLDTFDVGVHIGGERGDQHHPRLDGAFNATVTDDTALVTEYAA
jgi:hypothetical protein